MLKVLIAGSRDFEDYTSTKDFINYCLKEMGETSSVTVLSGGCRGTDKLGELYAEEYGYEVRRYPADWKRFGKAAGPIRNEMMVKEADIIICFPKTESRGSMSVIRLAEKYGKEIYIKYV